MNSPTSLLKILSAVFLLVIQDSSTASAGEDLDLATARRHVQIVSVDLEAQIIRIFNFSRQPLPLQGWTLCSSDDNENDICTNGGFDDVVLERFGTLFIHLRDDAPPEANHLNGSEVGNFASPLDGGPYSLTLYFPPFALDRGEQVADHLQWTPGDVENPGSGVSSRAAEAGGVWTDDNEWIATAGATAKIHLIDESGSALHGPEDFITVFAPADCNANGTPDPSDLASGASTDCNLNGIPDECDVASGLLSDLDANGLPDWCEAGRPILRGDCNADGTVDISDSIFTLAFSFLGQEHPSCQNSCDSNDDGTVDISDAVTTLGVLFLGSGTIPPPGMTHCGVDPTSDDLDCETPPARCR